MERVESGRIYGTLFFLVYVQCYSALWWPLGDKGLTVVLVKKSIVLMHSLVSTLFVCELSFWPILVNLLFSFPTVSDKDNETLTEKENPLPNNMCSSGNNPTTHHVHM